MVLNSHSAIPCAPVESPDPTNLFYHFQRFWFIFTGEANWKSRITVPLVARYSEKSFVGINGRTSGTHISRGAFATLAEPPECGYKPLPASRQRRRKSPLPRPQSSLPGRQPRCSNRRFALIPSE